MPRTTDPGRLAVADAGKLADGVKGKTCEF